MSRFKPATKYESKARIALMGPAKSGKSMSALLIARGLAGPAGRIAACDSEHGSLSKYSDVTPFDVDELTDFSPTEYIRCIREAEAARYDVLILDSLSHAWAGKGGILQQVDQASASAKGAENKFTAWRDPSKLHTELIDAIHSARLHIIATLRAKMAYVLEPDDRGKMKPRKVGLQPIQREELEYEFDFVGTLDSDHVMHIGESRMGFGFTHVTKPDVDFGRAILGWLSGEKQPLVGRIGDMVGVDLRTASAAAIGRYVAACKQLGDGKQGPKADALRAHQREVERLFEERMQEETTAAESGSYLDNSTKEE